MAAPDLVPVLLRDGTELRLCVGINAICDFEAALVREGFDAERELARLEAGFGTVSAARALIWASAKDQHEGLTLRHVGALMQTNGAALQAGLSEALTRARPEKADDPAGDDAPGKATPPAG